jgi:hypothetical protein
VTEGYAGGVLGRFRVSLIVANREAVTDTAFDDPVKGVSELVVACLAELDLSLGAATMIRGRARPTDSPSDERPGE